MIAEITNGMESVRLPSDNSSDNVRMESVQLEAAAEGRATVVTPITRTSACSKHRSPPPTDPAGIRPFDVVKSAGPAQHPIAFPPPKMDRGVRDNVLCYNQRTQRFIKAENVLFRDYSGEFGDDALAKVERAYWPVPHKKPIKTIMGKSVLNYDGKNVFMIFDTVT